MKFQVSLRRGLITFVAVLLIATLLIISLINGLFIERVYLMQVQSKLIGAFNTLMTEGYENYETLSKIENENIIIYVVAPGVREVKYMSRTHEPDIQFLAQRIIDDVEYGMKFVTSEIGDSESFFIYRQDGNTEPSSSGGSVSMGEKITIGGQLSTGEYVLMEASYEPIADTAELSLKFTLISGMLVLIIALIFVAFLTPDIAAPIEQIKQSAKSIANKDFSVRCEPSFIDEVSSLGESINAMSTQLQLYTLELEQANEKLRRDIVEKAKAAEAHKNLISNISHDLKTPLAIISGYAEGLKSGMAMSQEQIQEYSDIICDEADRMLSLILKLLEISRLESGTTSAELEDFDVVEILDYLSSSFALTAAQQNVAIEKDYPESEYINSDYFCVEQVLTNYVQNALHHGTGHRVIIGLRDMGERVEIYVFNEGEQIPEAHLTNIWKSFYKVDKSRTRSHSESGLGLAIVQGSMQLLGMPYGVRNVEGGVEFWIHLPKSRLADGDKGLEA